MNTNSILKIKKLTNPLLKNTAGEMTTPLIFILPKLFANPTLYLYWTSLKYSICIKTITMLSTGFCHPSFIRLMLNLISRDSFYSSNLYKYLLILFSYWSILWLLLPTVGSTVKLYIRVEFAISLCTEEGMLNSTETAVCNLSDFYWCFKRCLFPCMPNGLFVLWLPS